MVICAAAALNLDIRPIVIHDFQTAVQVQKTNAGRISRTIGTQLTYNFGKPFAAHSRTVIMNPDYKRVRLAEYIDFKGKLFDVSCKAVFDGILNDELQAALGNLQCKKRAVDSVRCNCR